MENMRLLSRKEEMILLAIWKLQNDNGAYGVTIRSYIEKMTGIKWLFGAIYGPLGRLVDYGYVESYESDPLPERGGRRKILYRLTPKGKTELLTVNKLNKALWQDINQLYKILTSSLPKSKDAEEHLSQHCGSAFRSFF